MVRVFLDENLLFCAKHDFHGLGEHIRSSLRNHKVKKAYSEDASRYVGKSLADEGFSIPVEVIYPGMKSGSYHPGYFRSELLLSQLKTVVERCKSTLDLTDEQTQVGVRRYKSCIDVETVEALKRTRPIGEANVPPRGSADFDIRTWATNNQAVIVSADDDPLLESRLGSDRLAVLPVSCVIAETGSRHEKSVDELANEVMDKVAAKLMAMQDLLDK